jgi:hypothetical protein
MESELAYKRYLKILDFAQITADGAEKLWVFIATATPMQRAMIIAKQKMLLKNEEISKELSQSENSIVYLLTAANKFMNRTKSSDDYLALDDDTKQEFAQFDNTELGKHTKADRRRVYLKDISKKRKDETKATHLQMVAMVHYHEIYSLYTYGYSWEEITKKVNASFGLDVTRRGLFNAFKKISGSLGKPLPEKGKRNKKTVIDDDKPKNQYSNEFIASYLKQNEGYIAEKRKEGVSYRALAEDLSKKMELRIGHSALYLYCVKHGLG